MVHLHVLTPIDWPALRTVRLAALRDSPHAFMSRYEHECQWQEPEWRNAFNAATWVTAKDADALIGLARSIHEPAQSGVRYLESIWVAPDHRRRGVLRSILNRLVEVEQHRGATRFLMWVLEDNHVARRAYEALSFEPTGERQYLPALGRFECQYVWRSRSSWAC